MTLFSLVTFDQAFVARNFVHHVQVVHWVCYLSPGDCHQFRFLTKRSGLAWHTEEATLRQKFEEFGPVEEAVCAIFLFPFRGRVVYFYIAHFVFGNMLFL